MTNNTTQTTESEYLKENEKREKRALRLTKPLDLLIAEYVFGYEILETYLEICPVYDTQGRKIDDLTVTSILVALVHPKTEDKKFRQVIDKKQQEKIHSMNYAFCVTPHYTEISFADGLRLDLDAIRICQRMSEAFGYNAMISIFPETPWKKIPENSSRTNKTFYNCYFQANDHSTTVGYRNGVESFYEAVAMAALDILGIDPSSEFIEAVEA